MPGRKYFFSLTKKEKLVMIVKNQTVTYLMCEKIWDKFETKNMSDCHDHYLKEDVMLLANVFEKFTDTCLKFYGLDPCHCSSFPELECNVKNDWCKVRKNIRD